MSVSTSAEATVRPLDAVAATRYVTPLREGGSLPGLVEADDLGIYVLKFRGAGQGVKVLVAEIVVTEMARLVGIPVPRLALVELDAQIAKYEADEEVQDLLNASIGLNLGVDYLPGSFGYDGSKPPDAAAAALILWLDAFTANVDRTWDNPNLLLWHRRTWAIDHGAALWFHHGWPSRAPDAGRFARQPFDASTHVLREVASDPRAVHDRVEALLTPAALASILALVPDAWLEPTPWLADPASVRAAYLELLTARLAEPDAWLPDLTAGATP
ncbi:MAG: HipA family kinase [Lapillicoccus sp.]